MEATNPLIIMSPIVLELGGMGKASPNNITWTCTSDLSSVAICFASSSTHSSRLPLYPLDRFPIARMVRITRRIEVGGQLGAAAVRTTEQGRASICKGKSSPHGLEGQ